MTADRLPAGRSAGIESGMPTPPGGSSGSSGFSNEKGFPGLDQVAPVLAHEVRNPLTILRGWLQFLDRSENPAAALAERPCLLPFLIAQTDRISNLFEHLLCVTQPPPLQREIVALSNLLDLLAEAGPGEGRGERLRIECRKPPGEIVLAGNPERLQKALSLLLQHALESAEAFERVEPGATAPDPARAAKADPAPTPVRFSLEVAGPVCRFRFSHGRTRAADDSRDLIDLLSLTGNMTGLGLAAARAIIQQHGGRLYLRVDEEGAEFVAELPVLAHIGTSRGDGNGASAAGDGGGGTGNSGDECGGNAESFRRTESRRPALLSAGRPRR